MAQGRHRSGTRRTLVIGLVAMVTISLFATAVPAGSARRGETRAIDSAQRQARTIDRAKVAREQRTLDVRDSGRAVGVSSRTVAARASLARSLGSLGSIQSDPVTGSLRFVGRLDGFLTGPSARSASSVALGYVRANRAAFGLRAADLRSFRLRRDYVDIDGTHHLSWVQRAGGLTVFGQGMHAAVTAGGRLVNVTGGPVRGLRAPRDAARLDAGAAIRAARAGRVASASSDRRDTAELALFPTSRGTRLAWKTFTSVSPSETDLSLIDAVTGKVLYRTNLTDAGAPPPTTATTGDDIWPFYYSSIPSNGGGVPADDVDLGPIFDMNPLTTGLNGPQLFGPNAWVFKDVLDDSFPNVDDAIKPTGGSAGAGFQFDFNVNGFIDTTTRSQNCSDERVCTWDLTKKKSWKAQLRHDAAQVFFFLNHFHDHLEAAPIGFNDAAGNFEFGGTGGPDMVLANTSDGANTDHGFPDLNHVDNANMSTPPDGIPPTMQMYLFRKLPRFGLRAIPSTNGGDDAEVVYHEYGHGLSNRLVTYPDGNSGLDNQQAGSMGEAWSDWYALDFLNQGGYKPDDEVQNGNLVMGELSFNSLLRTQPVDCAPGVGAGGRCPGGVGTGPGGFTYGDLGKILGFPEVHRDGEIWLETLWDLRTALDTNGTAAGGSGMAQRLVTRGMELSVPSPSFLDMRNAILQADQVANGGANQTTIWQVFADRGMGYFAFSEDGNDVKPVEDFDTPPSCGPCSSISGTVTDKLTDEPIQSATVSFPGLGTGFGFSLSDTTAANGTYTITDVPHHDAYAGFLFAADGYEPRIAPDVVVDGNEMLNRSLFRDWAALSGGAALKSFTPPDYAEFCGTNANGAFDLSLGRGWPSDSAQNDASGVGGPRKTVVRLAATVDVVSFAVASGPTCGDGPKAAVKHFKIQTRTSNTAPWKLAVDAKAKKDGVLRTYKPKKGFKNVQTIRFVMLSNFGHPAFMDVLEVSVRGTMN